MRPLLLGLTGSIGMGKTTTAGMFAELGVPVWDADAAVHRIYAPAGPGAESLAAIVPGAIAEDGSIDRQAMKQAIAQDPALLRRIEDVVHPLVARDRESFLQENAEADIVLLDIPLLYETGADAWLDRVVVVTTDPDEQRRRVFARPGVGEETFRQLMARQMPDEQKRQKADHIIRTDSLEETRQAVECLLSELKRGGDA